MTPENDNDPQILMGAKAIAAYLGVTQRQAYRLVYECGLPHFKLGGTVAARRASLSAWVLARELASRAA